jgi:hypothetical protein
VIEAQTGRAGCEANATLPVGRNVRRALFGDTVDVRRQTLPVPLQLLGRRGLVDEVDHDRPPSAQAQQRTGEAADMTLTVNVGP